MKKKDMSESLIEAPIKEDIILSKRRLKYSEKENPLISFFVTMCFQG